MNQYLAGDLDFTDRIPPSEKDRLQQMLGNQVVLSPIFATAMFSFNFDKPPFAGNPKLRLALNIAVGPRHPRKIRLARGRRACRTTSCRRSTGYDPAIPDWAKTFAGRAPRPGSQALSGGGLLATAIPLETVLTYPSGGPDDRRFMEALSAMWQMNLGAQVQIYNVEWKVLLQSRQHKAAHALLGCLDRRLSRPVHVHAALPDRLRHE